MSTEAGRIAVLPRSGDSFFLGTASVAVCMLRRRLLCLLSFVSFIGLVASPAGGINNVKVMSKILSLVLSWLHRTSFRFN
jgi:hypothetical protein